MKKILLLAGVCLFALNVVNACDSCPSAQEETAVVAQAPVVQEAVQAEAKAEVVVAANEVKEDIVAKEDTKDVTTADVAKDLEKAFAELEKDSKEDTKTA
ncbi:MAG: hypothetical protein ABH827_01165 [bacterium]